MPPQEKWKTRSIEADWSELRDQAVGEGCGVEPDQAYPPLAELRMTEDNGVLSDRQQHASDRRLSGRLIVDPYSLLLFSSRAEARSRPNGFSTTTRAPCAV